MVTTVARIYMMVDRNLPKATYGELAVISPVDGVDIMKTKHPKRKPNQAPAAKG
jgi:hypothetical protein